jgi:hypothetical protein
VITKKSLFRKISILSLAVLVFISSLLGANANTANAIGVDTAIKLVGGKAVVRALAEKVGMTLSKKQVDNVAGFIEKKTFDGDPKAIEFANKANNLTSSGSSLKEGFKKYLLDPSAWLLGLDLLFLAADAFQDGYEGGTPVDLYTKCVPPGSSRVWFNADGATFSSSSGWKFPMYANDGSKTAYIGMFQAPYASGQNSGYKPQIASDVSVKTSIYGAGYVDMSYSMIVHTGELKTSKVEYYSNSEFTSRGLNIEQLIAKMPSSEYNICSYPVTEEEVINTSNVDNLISDSFNNDTYVTNTTYNIEIEMPDVVNYDDSTPWNDVDTNLGKEVAPPPPDSDNDGVPDETDSDADKGGWLENLLPIVTLIIIFDLLKAVIFYLARMFEFILTIPLIDAKPIDNVAFEWFRTAKIVGIEIYSVISLLATIGLSFAVYKVVRRLLP